MIATILLLVYFFGAVSFYFGLIALLYYPLAFSYPFWERRLLARARASGYTPRVSVLVPAYNEEKVIGQCVESVLASDYPELEIIVVNDGSRDGTEAVLRPYIEANRIRYLSKPNGGKASALNAGLALVSGDITLFTDADSVFERDTVRNGVAYFADPAIGAVGGNDTPLHPRGLMQKMLVVTSHISTGFVRRALSIARVLPIIPGNLGLVRTAILKRVGGFAEVWGEDLELTLRLQRARVRVVYGASTRVLAECPSTITGLWKQRVRWMRSYLKVLHLHRDMLGNPRFGLFGPFLLFNAVNMIGVPLLQVVALMLLLFVQGLGHTLIAGWEWVAYLGWLSLFATATAAILLDRAPRDLLYLPYAALLIVFSHFYNLVVAHSVWAEWGRREETWNKLDRRGIPGAAARAHGPWRFVGDAMFVLIALGAGYWWGMQSGARVGDYSNPLPLVEQYGTTAVAIHFDGWDDWRDAYRKFLAAPESRYVNRVAVSAGRSDWSYFRWPGNERWWSAEQTRADVDMLEETLARLQARGYRTTAILDVFASRYLALHPDAAAADADGRRSTHVVCSTVLAEGDYGEHLVQTTAALAAQTSADSVAITELFYDRYCFDDRCLVAYRKATGRNDWPRLANGKIDMLDAELGAWRSRQVAGVVARLSQAVRAVGKRLYFDVKLSRDDITRNSAENGQDYRMLAPWVDEFVAWNYFAIDKLPPESSADVAAYFDDEFGADRYFLSVGLWDGEDGYIAPEQLARALRAAGQGGARNLWLTPGNSLTPEHWKAVADAVRRTGAASTVDR